MGELIIDLIPDLVGLVITPAAIVGCILLLESQRPVPNALAFATGFVAWYLVLAAAVLLGAASSGEGVPDETWRHVVSLVVGLLFLLGALVLLIRPVKARTGPPRWATMLELAHPRLAFAIGAGMALLNPNIAILLSGLTAVTTAGVGGGEQVVATALLIAACALDFIVPIGAFVILGDRARTGLSAAKAWMLGHDRLLTMGVLALFGLIFTFKGISAL